MTKLDIIEYALHGAREEYLYYINEQRVAEGTPREGLSHPYDIRLIWI